MIKTIEELVNLDATSGHEKIVKQYLKEKIKASNVYEDNLGGIAFKFEGSKKGKTLLIAAHMDEVGFVLKNVTSRGLGKLFPTGGFQVESLLSQRVVAYANNGDNYEGIILGKSKHLLTGDEKYTMNDLDVDFGFDTLDEFQASTLEIGDQITLKSELTPLKGSRYVSKAIDNRLGCAAIVEIANFLQEAEFSGTIILGATVQEEVGLRGASPLIQAIDEEIDEVLVVDVSPVDDTIKTDEAYLGGGALLRVADPRSILDNKLLQYYRTLAKDKEIKAQEYFSKGGTDAVAIQVSKNGYPTFALCVPARNIHTSGGVFDLKDYEAVVEIIKEKIKADAREN